MVLKQELSLSREMIQFDYVILFNWVGGVTLPHQPSWEFKGAPPCQPPQGNNALLRGLFRENDG